ncbi:MFS transporter [Rothia sp. P6271]|uniref:MFS transporter n=1 Tax=Rothia sp. P6271 TaxID=3402659 RepID=UPI003AD52FF8
MSDYKIEKFSSRFIIFLAAQSISWAGASMTPTALMLGLLELKFSPSDIGIIVACNSIFLILFLSYGGVASDRFSKFKIAAFAQSINFLSLVILSILFYTENTQPYCYIISSSFSGASYAFINPATKGAIKQLVTPGLINKANSLRSILKNILYIAGPSIAALITSLYSAYYAVLVDVISSFIVILLFFILFSTSDDSMSSLSGKDKTLLYSLRNGISTFFSIPWVWRISLCYFFTNFIFSGLWLILAPIVISEEYGKEYWGILLSVRSLGLLFAGVFSYRELSSKYPVLNISLGSMLGGILFIFIGLDTQYAVLCFISMIFGFGSSVSSIAWDSLIQKNISESHISRIISLDMTLSFLSVPLGQIFIPLFTSNFSLSQVFVIGGILYIALLSTLLVNPYLRNLK